MQGLRLAEDNDPLGRAGCGAVIVDSLTQTIVDSSATADGEELALLGEYVAAVRSQAVEDNLERVAVDDLDRAGRQEYDRIKRQPDDAMGVLEQSLHRAPPPARAGLARALEAARAAGDDRPDGGKFGQDRVPPGLATRGKGKEGPHVPPGLGKQKRPVLDK